MLVLEYLTFSTYSKCNSQLQRKVLVTSGGGEGVGLSPGVNVGVFFSPPIQFHFFLPNKFQARVNKWTQRRFAAKT